MRGSLLRTTVEQVFAATHPANERERCVALHDFVRDEIEFGFTDRFEAVAPEHTLQLKQGHCNAQADLLRALLETADIPARLRFVNLDKRILRHAVPAPLYYCLPATLFHAVTQVRQANSWLNTDSYIFSEAGFRRQHRRLIDSGLVLGYGLTRDGTCHWNATGDAFAQACPADLTAVDPIFPCLEAATAAGAGNNTLCGIHFNQWLQHTPRPLKSIWHRYANSRL